MFGNPTSDTFAKWDLEVVDDVGMGVFGSAQDQVAALQHIDEAGVAIHQVRNKFDDLIKNFVHRIGCSDAGSDIVQEIQCRTGSQRIHTISFYRRMKERLIDSYYGADCDYLLAAICL